MTDPTENPEEPSAPADSPGAAESPEPAPEPAPVGWLPESAGRLFGDGATASEAYALLTVDVPAASWLTALRAARDTLGCTYFDWLSAVDEPGTGFLVCAHLVALPGGTDAAAAGGLRRLVVRTTVPHDRPELPTATGVYAGAGWHERETHEMFGVEFAGHPHLVPLLLPDGFEGHPLRKDFVLAARVAKAWPGAKEPGEGADHGGPKRRQMLPPGVPDPNEWGPLKGQLPPAPARPARGRAAVGERPARRTRSAAAGSASQSGAAAGAGTPAERPARRTRTDAAGSASPRTTPTEPKPTAEPGAEKPAGEPKPATEAPASGTRREPRPPRSADAPWHDPKPAFDAPPADDTADPTADGTGTGESDGNGNGDGDGRTEDKD